MLFTEAIIFNWDKVSKFEYVTVCSPKWSLTHYIINIYLTSVRTNIEASLVAQQWQICLLTQETHVRFLGLEDPLEREITTHSSILAGKSYGQRTLVGYSPWGYKRLRYNLAKNDNNDPPSKFHIHLGRTFFKEIDHKKSNAQGILESE